MEGRMNRLRMGINNTILRTGCRIDDRTAACKNTAVIKRTPVRKENATYASDTGAYKKDAKKIARHARIPIDAIFATRMIHTGCLSESVSAIEAIYARSTFPIVKVAATSHRVAIMSFYRRKRRVLYEKPYSTAGLRCEKFEFILGAFANLGTPVAVGNKF